MPLSHNSNIFRTTFKERHFNGPGTVSTGFNPFYDLATFMLVLRSWTIAKTVYFAGTSSVLSFCIDAREGREKRSREKHSGL